jgi:gamma-glutamylcyclotransferase (GGCT)/AIG2-like uncharacterized protein YtfP
MTQTMYVYGTLRRDMGYRLLTPHEPIPIGFAVLKGAAMYSLGGYPGIVPSNHPSPDGEVIGQLLSYEHLDKDSWNEVLCVVDCYEGPYYNRRMTTVTGSDGVETEVWVYWPANPQHLIDNYTHITSGDWKAFVDDTRKGSE